MALLPDAGQGDAARSHHGPLHHVFRPDKRPSTHRHPLRKVSSGLALRGSVAGSDPAAARPNESVMLGPSAVNTAKPASPSSRWSQALPVEGVTPADMAVLSMGERTRPPTPRQATAPCSVTMDDQTCDHGKSQSSAARPARCTSRDDSLEPAVNRCGRRFGKPTMAPSARPICTPPLLRSANPRVSSRSGRRCLPLNHIIAGHRTAIAVYRVISRALLADRVGRRRAVRTQVRACACGTS